LRVIPASNSERREWEQRDHASALDRHRELPLMLSAISRRPARHDFAALRDEALQRTDVLVIDRERFVGAETAYFAPPAAAAPRASTIASAAFAAPAIALPITV
jgi:hypothetical protein